MKNLSFTVLDGFLTADPEKKTTASGKTVTTFSIAVNHSYGEDSEVSFVDIEAWEREAEKVAENAKKGTKVTVIGKFRQDRWKAADGTGRSKMKVVAEDVRFDSNFFSKGEKKAA